MKKSTQFFFAFIFSVLTFSGYSISHIYIFGDDYSDMGYQDINPNIPFNKEPTYVTQGWYPWPYYLALKLHVPIPLANNENPIPVPSPFASGTLNGPDNTDYAAGGATTTGTGFGDDQRHYLAPALDRQVNQYLQDHGMKADPNGLYIIWIGINDSQLLIQKDLYTKSPEEFLNDFVSNAENWASNLLNTVNNLKTAGARNIIFINLLNLGYIPFAKNPLLPPDSGSLLPQASLFFNIALQEKLSGQGLIGVDVFTLIAVLVTAVNNSCSLTQQRNGTCNYQYNSGLATYTIANAIDSSCNNLGSALMCSPAQEQPRYQNYIFADSIHFSGMMNQIIADNICITLNSKGITCK